MFYAPSNLYHTLHQKINPFPNDRILDMTKLKAFADDKLNVAKLTVYLFIWVENTVWKGENAGYQHFHLFPQCFQDLNRRHVKYSSIT